MPKIEGTASRVESHTLGAAALAADDAVLADTAMDQTNPTEVEAFAGQPDVARVVSVKGNDGNVAGNVVIEGLNIGGEVITETIALAGAAVVTGAKAFASVTKVTLPTWTVANTERVRVGTGPALGLPVKLARNSVLYAFLNGVREATAPTVVFSAAALESNTITLNSALDGSTVIADLYDAQ